MTENNLPRILNYWRNCLADAARINIDPKRFQEAFETTRGEVKSGRINSVQAEKIFAAYWESKKRDKQQKKDSFIEEDDENLPIKVLVCPVAAFPKTVDTMNVAGKDKVVTPVWIPAELFKRGDLYPASEDLPWIPRNLLEPIERSGDTIGDTEAVDDFLSLNPSPVNEEDKEQPPRWVDVWQYSDEMLRNVAQQFIEDFNLDDYVVANCSYILLDLEDEKMWLQMEAPTWTCAWFKPNQCSPSRIGGFSIWEPILVYGQPKKRVGQDGWVMPIATQRDVGNHPCPKFLPFWIKLLSSFIEPGQCVLDPFLGSSTTLNAARNLGCHAIGIEVEERYCQIAVERLAQQPLAFSEAI